MLAHLLHNFIIMELNWNWKYSKRKCLFIQIIYIFIITLLITINGENNVVNNEIVTTMRITFVQDKSCIYVDLKMEPKQPDCFINLNIYPVCHHGIKGITLFKKTYDIIPLLSNWKRGYILSRELLLIEDLNDLESLALYAHHIDIEVDLQCSTARTLLKSSFTFSSLEERNIFLDRTQSVYGMLRQALFSNKITPCKNENGAVMLLPAIVPITGHEDSYVKKLNISRKPSYSKYFVSDDLARFTVAFWVFLDGPCELESCSILIRRNEKTYLSPVILLNKAGFLHIQVGLTNNDTVAYLTDRQTPLHQWLQVTLAVAGNQIDFFVSKFEGETISYHYKFICPATIKYDAAVGFWMFGGFWFTVGSSGYIGNARLYPYDHLITHRLFDTWQELNSLKLLGVESHSSICSDLKETLILNVKVNKKRIEANTCSFMDYLLTRENETLCQQQQEETDESVISHPWLFSNLNSINDMVYLLSKTIIKSQILEKNFTVVSTYFEKVALRIALDDKASIKDVIDLLLISGCLGNPKSYYLLAALYSIGYRGLTYDDKDAINKLHLYASHDGYPLSQIALATNYMIGTNGIKKNYAIATGYLRAAAVKSKKIIEEEDSGVQTALEMINLADADKFSNQRGEDSDAHSWLTYQASMGQSEAMTKLGHMYFNGQSGIVAHRPTAIQYFEQAANLSDAGALYTLGVIYLRGLSVEENKTKAIELFKKSSAQNFSQADNSLGYVELVLNKNRTAALEHFQRAAERNDTDGIFHYGSMHDPSFGEPSVLDLELAFQKYKLAAAKGHKAALMKMGEAYMTGVRMPYNPHDAMWNFRVIAQLHPDLGRFLRNGIDGYIRGDWIVSFFNYLLAAESGLELANYNAAYSCEDFPELQRFLNAKCPLRFYNTSSQLGWSDSVNKMADFHWYGNHGVQQNTTQAAELYCRACGKDETPLALYNVGYLVEHGFPIINLNFTGINETDVISGNKSLARHLYWSCLDNARNEFEGFMPCFLAWSKLTIEMVFLESQVVVMCVFTSMALLGISIFLLCSRNHADI